MMSIKTVFFVILAVSAGLSSVDVLADDYPRAEIIEQSLVCLDCHDGMTATLDGSAHQLSTAEGLVAPQAVGCINCHEGWAQHLDDPSRETIVDLSALSSHDQAATCGACHQTPHQSAMVISDPHARAGLNCTSCHTIHGNNLPRLLPDDRATFCLDCHPEIKSEFARRSAHPLESGNITCLDCHDLSGMSDPMLAVGLNWSCQDCHSELSGPFLYEHPVVNSHLVDGGGCIECHEPHGSPNDRLLTQPNDGTCRQCHGIPIGHRQAHAGLGSKLACVDCHSEIHGSYDNPKLLDPQLGTILFPNCYQSGCHAIYE